MKNQNIFFRIGEDMVLVLSIVRKSLELITGNMIKIQLLELTRNLAILECMEI